MVLRGALGDEEFGCDGTIAEALGNKYGDFELPGGQTGGCVAEDADA